MKKLIILLVILSSAGLHAHQADISRTMLLEQEEGNYWESLPTAIVKTCCLLRDAIPGNLHRRFSSLSLLLSLHTQK